MTIEVMIDLETYGLPPAGMIISIGAVKFDPETQQIVDRFHLAIDPETYESNRLADRFTINAGTVKWWMATERDQARQAFIRMPKVDPGSAIAGFLMWYGSASLPTWGNAVTFDVVLLKHMIEALHMDVPWMFWDEKCHRTLKGLAHPDFTKRAFSEGVRRAVPGVLHSALFDAEVQAWQNMICRSPTVWGEPILHKAVGDGNT